jgi:L-fuconolactonase
MLQPDFLRGLELLGKTSLRYDLLIFGHQLPNSIKMVDHVPELPIVLDHIAKPAIDPAKFDRQWADDLSRLAERTHVCCKLSGMVTEVRGEVWDIETLRPYAEHAINCFGPSRLMFGSDWPVCRRRAEYSHWVSLVMELIAGMSADEQDQILYRTAANFYGTELA